MRNRPEKNHRPRRIAFVFLLYMSLFILWFASQEAARIVVLNTSSSLPPGLYLRAKEAPQKSVLIEFYPPQAARDFALQKWRRTSETTRFIKPVVATTGDHVDATGDVLIVNGERLGPIQNHDSEGVELPRWRKARILETDEFFVFSDRVTQSFDSRYFGPVKREQILAVRRPLFTW